LGTFDIARAAAICTIAALGCSAGAALAAGGLPGGATALNEAHADWILNCQVQNGATHCAVSQQQFDKGTKQLMLSLSFNPEANGGVKGVAVLPFGLNLGKGVTFQLDSSSPTAPSAFSTCLRGGCLVPLAWPADTVKDLRGATNLKVAALGANGQPASFTVPMSGFGAALDRAIELGGQP